MTWRSVRAVAGLALGTLLVLGSFSACDSPTLPTPPPGEEPPALDIPDAELASDGEHVDLAGFALPGATVIVINRSLLVTDIAEASTIALASLDTGSYRARIRVDLRCVDKNEMDIAQRDNYGNDSKVRRFSAPNGFEDGATRPGGACTDAGDAGSGEAADTSDAGAE
jgi:hypothetical protein